jgi:hypothetical protein
LNIVVGRGIGCDARDHAAERPVALMSTEVPVPEAFENSGGDRAEMAQKRRKFLAELGTGPVVDHNTGKGSSTGRRQRPTLTRFASMAAVTATVGAAMLTGSGVASAAGCTSNGNPLPIPKSQTYYCGAYWDNYNYEYVNGGCYFFDHWWNILACAGGPSWRGEVYACA